MCFANLIGPSSNAVTLYLVVAFIECYPSTSFNHKYTPSLFYLPYTRCSTLYTLSGYVYINLDYVFVSKCI